MLASSSVTVTDSMTTVNTFLPVCIASLLRGICIELVSLVATVVGVQRSTDRDRRTVRVDSCEDGQYASTGTPGGLV